MKDRVIFTETKKLGTFARAGVLHTRRGDVITPTFMPDGTRGAVKSLTPEQVEGTGVEIVLANTYHLHLNPGEQAVKQLGGLHAFANRQGPMLTDSGGFQVFSLGQHVGDDTKSSNRPTAHQSAPVTSFSQSRSDNYAPSKKDETSTRLENAQSDRKNSHRPKITEEGVHFRDPKTGDKHFISPEISMQIQLDLGADMIVAFDHLVGLGEEVTPTKVKDAFDRTHRWLQRCIVEFKKLTKDMIGPEDPEWSTDLDDRADLSASNAASRTNTYDEVSSRSGKSGMSPKRRSSAGSSADGQARRIRRPLLFGVVQGGLDIELRKESLRIIQESDVDGIAIGGLSVGETREEMRTVLEVLAPLYDDKRPRFLLGVGTPEDLKIAVENGIDMLDCVLPTRNARHGTVWRTRETAHSGRNPASSGLTMPSARLRSDARIPSQTAPSHEFAIAPGTESIKMTLTNEQFKLDSKPIDEGCDCYTCAGGFSRAFLRHQFKSGDPLAGTLASIHNLRHMMRLCEGYRK